MIQNFQKNQHGAITITGFTIIAAFCVYNLIVAGGILSKFNKSNMNSEQFHEKYNINIYGVSKSFIVYIILLMLCLMIIVANASQYLPASNVINESFIIAILIILIGFTSYTIHIFRNSNKTEGDLTKGLVGVSSILLAALILITGSSIYLLVKSPRAKVSKIQQ